MHETHICDIYGNHIPENVLVDSISLYNLIYEYHIWALYMRPSYVYHIYEVIRTVTIDEYHMCVSHRCIICVYHMNVTFCTCDHLWFIYERYIWDMHMGIIYM